MSEFWEEVLERSDSLYDIETLETAAYRLVAEQILYRADRRSATAYNAIAHHERDMQVALAPLGLVVNVNRRAQYAYAIPARAKPGSATLKQTLLALVLRKVYDIGAGEGRFNESSEVMCDLVELDETYRQATLRPFPGGGELTALIQTMKRWGLVRIIQDETAFEGNTSDQPYELAIRPGIVDVLGEAALARLAEWAPRDEEGNLLDVIEIDEEESEV